MREKLPRMHCISGEPTGSPRHLLRHSVSHTGNGEARGSASVLAIMGITDVLDLEETLLYASAYSAGDASLRRWLTSTIERLPSWRVSPSRTQAAISDGALPALQNDDECVSELPATFVAKPEKGVDTAIVTDMLSPAWQDAYDIAVLIRPRHDYRVHHPIRLCHEWPEIWCC
jgi:hypothetical protein